jgi:hypothetical protein
MRLHSLLLCTPFIEVTRSLFHERFINTHEMLCLLRSAVAGDFRPCTRVTGEKVYLHSMRRTINSFAHSTSAITKFNRDEITRPAQTHYPISTVWQWRFFTKNLNFVVGKDLDKSRILHNPKILWPIAFFRSFSYSPIASPRPMLLVAVVAAEMGAKADRVLLQRMLRWLSLLDSAEQPAQGTTRPEAGTTSMHSA